MDFGSSDQVIHSLIITLEYFQLFISWIIDLKLNQGSKLCLFDVGFGRWRNLLVCVGWK